MIPNFNGGASAQAVDPGKSETIKLLKRAGQSGTREIAKSLPLYWGPQPFTAGPMYMGAITLFLFVLGLCLYKGKEKWWLVAGTILAVLMAVGNHFMPFTKFCFNVLPLYNKFRTVSMALVVLQVTLPVLGFLTLDRIVRNEVDPKALRKGGIIAFALTGGFCLLCWLIPSLAGDFSAASDAGQQDVLVEAFQKDRISLLRSDALQSFVLILASAALLFWAFMPKANAKPSGRINRKWMAAMGICLLLTVNMFATGKRYLNADHFTTPKDFNKPFAERQVDRLIKADPDPSYRVLDLTVNVFNSSVPSYHHKSIGGYSPAKLQRYQDLIDHYLTGEINGLYRALQTAETLEDVEDYMVSTPVLNMLDTRYVILAEDYPPVLNSHAFGNAWFVDSTVVATSPDEEIALLGRIDPRHQAVVTSPIAQEPTVSTDSIVLTSYAPNELHYRYQAGSDRLAVFSEIFYPEGWMATVDGQPIELLRADWTLRAAMLPAGGHEVTMRFAPASYRIGERVSRASSISLILITLLAIAGLLWKKEE